MTEQIPNRGRRDATHRSSDRPARSRVVRRLTSIPALAAAVLVVTLLSAGGLQDVDQALNQPWRRWFLPTAGPALADTIDPLASQKVTIPLLGIVSVWLAWRRRTFRPVVSAAIAELGVVFLGGAMKLFFARPSPKFLDPRFFSSGLLAHGWGGISYPSGHAIEAVAMYGTLTLLVTRYGPGARWAVRCLMVLTVFVGTITVAQSFYMGWHWMTDLVAGVLTGLLIVRIVDILDRRVARPRGAGGRRNAPRPGGHPDEGTGPDILQ